MSRGFDGFEIDDFRDSDIGSGRDVGRGSSSDWNARINLHNIHREEDRADRLDREGRQRSRRKPQETAIAVSGGYPGMPLPLTLTIKRKQNLRHAAEALRSQLRPTRPRYKPSIGYRR